jgi:hypothetical protein
MIVPSHLALKTHTNFGCAASLATLDKLVDKFPLPPVFPPIGDTSLTHVMRFAAHSTTPPTPTAIMTLYLHVRSISILSNLCQGNIVFSCLNFQSMKSQI